MNHRETKLYPKSAPLVKGEAPDPNDNIVDLISIPYLDTRPTGPEERFSDKRCVAAVSSSQSVKVKLEEHAVDEAEPSSAPPGSGNDISIDNWTAEELFKKHETSQEAFMEEYRSAASQERSQLAQALQSELQAGMNQVFDYIKNTFMRPTQPSTHADLENLKNQLQSERTHVKDLKSNYNVLNHVLRQKREEVQRANAKLQDALQERDRLRKLLDGGSLANSSKVTDDDVKTKWSQINYNIRCLVHMLDNAPSAQSLDDDVAQRLRFLSVDYRNILRDSELREFLMRGYLWVLIQDNVFDSKESTWGGPDLRSYKATRDSLLDRIGKTPGRSENKSPTAHAARWLAQGSTMMNDMWEKDTNAIKHMVHTETKSLRPFVSDRQFRMDRVHKKISDQLSDIFNSAIELDQMMMCSKALFLIRWRDQSQNIDSLQRWNPEVMEAEAWEKDLSRKSHVKLRLSPILYKVGTADGQNYDSVMTMAKSKVVCD